VIAGPVLQDLDRAPDVARGMDEDGDARDGHARAL
jgi:hypothetical protein